MDEWVSGWVSEWLNSLRLVSDISDIHVYLELCDRYFYNDYNSIAFYFSDGSHQVSCESCWMKLLFLLLAISFPKYRVLLLSQYMAMIHGHLCASTFLPLREEV